MADLTEPQSRMLTKAMREDRVCYGGQQYRTARILLAAKFVTEGSDGGVLYLTRAGMQALRDYRANRYATRGTMADLLDMEEANKALAEFRS